MKGTPEFYEEAEIETGHIRLESSRSWVVIVYSCGANPGNNVIRGAKQSFDTVRSQAELGNEILGTRA